MLSTEREVFEVELAVLLAAFNTPVTQARRDAYWRGLERMPLPVFVRTVDALMGDGGDTDLPSPPRIWQLSREMRAKPPEATPGQPGERKYDDFHRFGQRALLRFIVTHDTPSEASLAHLIEVKNRIVPEISASYGGDAKACDESGGTDEFREILLGAFAREFAPRGWQEREENRERFCRDHGIPFAPMPQPELPLEPRSSSTPSTFEGIGEPMDAPSLPTEDAPW